MSDAFPFERRRLVLIAATEDARLLRGFLRTPPRPTWWQRVLSWVVTS